MQTIDLVSSWEIQYLAERFEKASGSGEQFSLHWTKVEPAVAQEYETTVLHSSHTVTQVFDQLTGRASKRRRNPLELDGIILEKLTRPHIQKPERNETVKF